MLVGGGVLAGFTATTVIAAIYEDSVAEGHLHELAMGNQDPSLRNSYAAARDLRNQLRTTAYIAGAATVTVGRSRWRSTTSTPRLRRDYGSRRSRQSAGGGAAVIGRF